jgi:hypothetical protein
MLGAGRKSDRVVGCTGSEGNTPPLDLPSLEYGLLFHANA